MMQPPTPSTRPCPRSDADALRRALSGDPQAMDGGPETTPIGGAHPGEAA